MGTSISPDLPAMAARRRRQATSSVAGSLLTTQSMTALASVGLEPVGEVMGSIAMYLPTVEETSGGCGGFRQGESSTRVSCRGRSEPQVRKLYTGYHGVLARMLREAEELGAEGIVDVALTWTTLDAGVRALTAVGTAVRHTSTAIARWPGPYGGPWCTELSAADVAKAAQNCWTPLSIVIGVALAFKHQDSQLRRQLSPAHGAPAGTEVTGLTEVIGVARREARRQLTSEAEQLYLAAQVVVSKADFRLMKRHCADGIRDFVAEATFVGTVLAHDPTQTPVRSVSTLNILPLS